MRRKDRSVSCVGIHSSTPPSVKIVSHRKPSAGNSERCIKGKDEISSTNDLLRKGGTLPYVFAGKAEIDVSGDSQKQASCQRSYMRKPSVKLNGEMEGRGLQQQVQHLTAEVSKMKQDLETLHQQPNSLESAEANSDNLRSQLAPVVKNPAKMGDVTIQDYLLMVTEMNENAHVLPYNPDEFTEGSKWHQSSLLKAPSNEHFLQAHWDTNKGALSDSNKSEILFAIQSELAKWREEQQQTNTQPQGS